MKTIETEPLPRSDADQEENLKVICVYIAVFHAICAPVAAAVAAQRKLKWFPMALKVTPLTSEPRTHPAALAHVRTSLLSNASPVLNDLRVSIQFGYYHWVLEIAAPQYGVAHMRPWSLLQVAAVGGLALLEVIFTPAAGKR